MATEQNIASIGEDGLPELPWGDDFEAWLEVRTGHEVRTEIRQYVQAAIAADRRAREVIDTLNNPPYGAPDLYSRLHTAMTAELSLATQHGKVTEWFTAARGWMDYEAAKMGADSPQAAQGVKDHEIRELVNTLRDIAVQYHGTQQLRSRIQEVLLPIFQRAQLARQSQGGDDTAAEMKRLHDALCFWLPQNHAGLPDAMQQRIAADAYLLVGYDDMPDAKSAEELGWIVAAPPLSSEQQATKGEPNVG
jgi:hypothetical protein